MQGAKCSTMVFIPHLSLCLVFATTGCRSWSSGPAFVGSAVNVTVSEGKHAFLPCRVSNLGDKSVTWLKRRSLHIITAGLLTYSPDDRYRVLHPAQSEEWTLHIRTVQAGDSGWYECQVNSDPKITRPVYLIVQDKSHTDPYYTHELEMPRNGTSVQMAGASEVHIQRGSVLSMACTVDHTDQEGPRSVVWYHGATRIRYDDPRGGIAIKTEKTAQRTVSRLMLSGVSPEDSGRYTCRPETGGTAAVTVHVQSGQQHQAAVQQSGHSASRPSLILLVWSLSHLLPRPST